MARKNKPRRRGVEVEKMDRLYEGLHQSGIAHKTIQSMSLRQAVLQLHGTPEAIDATFGTGFYAGIQRSTGRFTQYRKLWGRLLKEKAIQDPRRVTSLESLKAQIKVCLAVGVPDLDIVREVQRSLGFRGMLVL